MGFIYTDEQESIRELVRDFAKNELEPRAARMDQEEKLDPDIIKMMGEMGLMGIGIPEEYGGLGLGMMEKSIVGTQAEISHQGCRGRCLRVCPD